MFYQENKKINMNCVWITNVIRKEFVSQCVIDSAANHWTMSPQSVTPVGKWLIQLTDVEISYVSAWLARGWALIPAATGYDKMGSPSINNNTIKISEHGNLFAFGRVTVFPLPDQSREISFVSTRFILSTGSYWITVLQDERSATESTPSNSVFIVCPRKDG